MGGKTSKKCKKLKKKNNKKCPISKVGGCKSYPYSFSPTAAVQGAGATDGGVALFDKEEVVQPDQVSEGSAPLLGALVATIAAAFLLAAVAAVVVSQVLSRQPARAMSRLTRKLNCAEVGECKYEPALQR